MSKKIPVLASWFAGAIVLLSVACGDADPDAFVEGEPEGAPPVALYFEDVADPDQRVWNFGANQWIVSAPDSIAFYFRVETAPMPSEACGVLVRYGEANRLRLGPCLSVVEFEGEPDPCFVKEALAAMLGVAPGAGCEVTDADRGAVVSKWGKPWSITILPAGN